MTLEFLSLLVSLIGGSIIVRMSGINNWILPALGLLVGVSLQITIGFILLILSIPHAVQVLIALTLLLPVTIGLILVYRGRDLRISPKIVFWSLTLLCALFIALYPAGLVKWTSDSIEYVQLGVLVANGDYLVTPLDRMVELPLSLPILNSPAVVSGNLYMRTLLPLIGISTLATFSWLFIVGMKARINRQHLLFFALIGPALLLTTNRFVFSSFYINNHILFASLLLLVVGCGWLLNTLNDLTDSKKYVLLQSLVMPALVLTRPEGSLVGLLALFPTILLISVPWKLRRIPLLTLGASTLLWQGFLFYMYISSNINLPISVIAMFTAGIIMSVTALVPVDRLIQRKNRFLVRAADAGLWFTLLVSTVISPSIISDSFDSTVQNLIFGEGSWGLLVIMVALLALALGLTKHVKGVEALRFPITAFIPLMFTLAVIRGGAYRIGNGDSFNRALVHIMPLLVLYVTILAAAGKNRIWYNKLNEKMRPTG